MLIMLTHKSEFKKGSSCARFLVLCRLLIHKCVSVWCECVPEWVKRQEWERPGTKGLELGPGLAVRSRFSQWKTEKTTSLTDITSWTVSGPRTQNNDTDWDWHYKSQTVAYIGGFCVPLFILMLGTHQDGGYTEPPYKMCFTGFTMFDTEKNIKKINSFFLIWKKIERCLRFLQLWRRCWMVRQILF